ncbi:MAG: hypothetical protein E1N59_271 [Puniceicoccaceae bacterium 5H]|nr:MAG: hypothetical protein E1N59_271 [Puniceicoccaceae bacterium 5H]
MGDDLDLRLQARVAQFLAFPFGGSVNEGGLLQVFLHPAVAKEQLLERGAPLLQTTLIEATSRTNDVGDASFTGFARCEMREMAEDSVNVYHIRAPLRIAKLGSQVLGARRRVAEARPGPRPAVGTTNEEADTVKTGVFMQLLQVFQALLPRFHGLSICRHDLYLQPTRELVRNEFAQRFAGAAGAGIEAVLDMQNFHERSGCC